MKLTKHTTKIINDVSQVPQGWIRLKAYTQTHGGSIRRLLSRAHYEGKVRAMKIMKTPYDSHGAVFVEPNDAKEFIENLNEMKRLSVHLKSTHSKQLQLVDAMKFEDSMKEADRGVITELKRIADAQEQTVAILNRLESIWKN
jgi:hypothetical protein